MNTRRTLWLKRLLCAICALAAFVAAHAADFATANTFTAGYVWQEVGYVGLGSLPSASTPATAPSPKSPSPCLAAKRGTHHLQR